MKSPRSTQRGILLLEALIAILLISFGILGLIGLWASSLKDVSEAKYRTDASFLANEIIGQMWLDRKKVVPGVYTVVPTWTNRVAATLPGGTGVITVVDDPDVGSVLRTTVTIQWKLPGGATHTFVSIAQINGAGNI